MISLRIIEHMMEQVGRESSDHVLKIKWGEQYFKNCYLEVFKRSKNFIRILRNNCLRRLSLAIPWRGHGYSSKLENIIVTIQ